MRVACVSCFAPLWKRYPVNVLDLEEGMTIGGGEEAFIRTAVGLRALGHDVEAWHCGDTGVWRGVVFNSNEAPLYNRIVGEDWDAVCAWSGLRPLEYARPGVRRLFFQQLNDLTTLGDWKSVDCVVSPSLDHARNLRGWGWDGRQAVVHNGVDVELYQGRDMTSYRGGEVINPSTPWDERPFNVGYWSSPDRGLHHLLRAWPHVVVQEPRARLSVAYEIKRLLEWIRILPASFYGERGQTLARLVLEAQNDPTVTFLGSIPRKKLAKFQRQCRVHAYCCETFGYCEGFGTSVAQGLTAGCLVLLTPVDAFPSLYGDGVYWLRELDFMDRDYPRLLAQRIVQGLRGDLPDQDAIRKRGVQIGSSYTWDAAARQMEAACKGEWLPADYWRSAAA